MFDDFPRHDCSRKIQCRLHGTAIDKLFTLQFLLSSRSSDLSACYRYSYDAKLLAPLTKEELFSVGYLADQLQDYLKCLALLTDNPIYQTYCDIHTRILSDVKNALPDYAEWVETPNISSQVDELVAIVVLKLEKAIEERAVRSRATAN